MWRELVEACGFVEDGPLAGAGVADGHEQGLSCGSYGLGIGLLQGGSVGGPAARGAHLGEQEEAVGVLGWELYGGLPLLAELGEGRAKGNVVAELAVDHAAGPLVDGYGGVGEGPVVGGPQFGQAREGHGYGLALPHEVGVEEYEVVDGPEQGYFVAVGFLIVFEDSGNGLLTG